MPSLYVMEPGSRLECEYGRVLVTKDDEVLLRMPLQNISQVVLFGRVGLTTPAVQHLLQNKIPVTFLTSGGQILGRLVPATPLNLPLRRQQFRANDLPEVCLAVARAVVLGKINNQLVYLERSDRQDPEVDFSPVIARLQAAARSAAAAADLKTLLGIEGSSSRDYFAAYRSLFAAEWNFTRRTRRPPKDPVNALLSLGYTLLGHCAAAALEIVGLDPYLGFFHTEKYGRPALALDLMEEFRTPVVDSLVRNLVSRRRIQLSDFETEGGSPAAWLTRRALREFFHEFQEKMESTLCTHEIGRPISYQKHLEVQARKIAGLLQGKLEFYTPFKIR